MNKIDDLWLESYKQWKSMLGDKLEILSEMNSIDETAAVLRSGKYLFCRGGVYKLTKVKMPEGNEVEHVLSFEVDEKTKNTATWTVSSLDEWLSVNAEDMSTRGYTLDSEEAKMVLKEHKSVSSPGYKYIVAKVVPVSGSIPELDDEYFVLSIRKGEPTAKALFLEDTLKDFEFSGNREVYKVD